MKKRLLSLLMSVCLILLPMSVFAEDTDYSYLEDMSVKELKALRDAINDILGDDGGNSSEDEKSDSSSEIDLSTWNNENFASLAVILLQEKVLIDPYSLEINEINVGTINTQSVVNESGIPSLEIICHVKTKGGDFVITHEYALLRKASTKSAVSDGFYILESDLIPDDRYMIVGDDYYGFDNVFKFEEKLDTDIDTIWAYVDAHKKAGDYKIS